jgi:hypothetical protein
MSSLRFHSRPLFEPPCCRSAHRAVHAGSTMEVVAGDQRAKHIRFASQNWLFPGTLPCGSKAAAAAVLAVPRWARPRRRGEAIRHLHAVRVLRVRSGKSQPEPGRAASFGGSAFGAAGRTASSLPATVLIWTYSPAPFLFQTPHPLGSIPLESLEAMALFPIPNLSTPHLPSRANCRLNNNC